MKRAPVTGASTENDPDLLIPAARLAGRPLLLLLDVDGTLAPIAPHPTLAHVPDNTRRLIAALAATPGVTVVLVSGRAAPDAKRLVGVERVWTVGNHGAEIIAPNGFLEAAMSENTGTVERHWHAHRETAGNPVIHGVSLP